MLLKVLEKYKPEYVTCVFDTPAPSFRKEMYSEYKANRGAPPDDLLPQFEHIHKAVEVLGIHKIAEPGYEADDIIGTFARKFRDCDVVIVSTDKDLMQLVDERVSMLDTMKDIKYTPKEVEEKLGVRPEQVQDYLGLIGDSSDNIPGVAGIGPKGAVELLREYGSLEGVLQGATSMKAGKKRDALLEHEAIARLSKELATVKCDLDLVAANSIGAVSLSKLRAPAKVGAEFVQWAKSLEFNALVAKYGGLLSEQEKNSSGESFSGVVSVGTAVPKTQIVGNRADWQKLIKSCEAQPTIAFDTETRGDSVTELEIVGLSLAYSKESAFYVPLRHADHASDLDVATVLSEFQQLVRGKRVVAQNLKYDYKVLLAEGAGDLSENTTEMFDTMLAHYVLEPEQKHGLDALASRYLATTIGDFKETLGDRENFSLVPVKDAAQYAGLDAWSCFCLEDILRQDLTNRGLLELFKTIEMPVAPVLAHMEWNGVAVDKDILKTLSKEYGSELAKLETQIFELVGSEFNLNSPKQLSEILFTKLKLPVIQKTKTGFSTDVTVLEKLAPLHPVPNLLLQYREYTKLLNTYIEVLPNLIENDGRVHAHFNQAVTATGRLSSSDPNLQNIPIKTDRGRRIRQAFVAREGCVFVGADYSQVELRLVAHLSGDEALIKAFRAGADVHRATAAEIFGVKPEQVSDEQRAAAKAINFGLIYGKTPFGLSQELGISRANAAQYIAAYFERYSGVKEFMDQSLERARKHGEAVTLFGRKRRLPDIQNKNGAVRANAERMAMNTPVQGTAADLIKIAMAKVHDRIRKTAARLVLQVHDELVLEVPESQASEVESIVRDAMENSVKLDVPLIANIGTGKNWYNL